jgi:23S rRNA (adenine2503-C2)-methyltransferase
MTDLPGRLRAELAERFHVSLPKVEQRQVSRDGAVKYLLRLEDGKGMEAVYLPEKTGSPLHLFPDRLPSRLHLLPHGPHGSRA